MRYEGPVVAGEVYVGSPDGTWTPAGRTVKGFGTIEWQDPAPRTISTTRSVTAEFGPVKMLGGSNNPLMRLLFGLPYRHPRQIIHRGRKP